MILARTTRTRRTLLLLLAISASVLSCRTPPPADPAYVAEMEQWRQRREEILKAEGGWLSVAGLFWLHEGSNTFGTGEDNDIILPEGSAPDLVGTFEHADGVTTVRIEPGVEATIGEQPATESVMKPDVSGDPEILVVNDLTLYVIQREDRFGIRLKDKNSKYLKSFTHLSWYPVDERYRIEADWVPFNPPKKIMVSSIHGSVSEADCPGQAVFTIGGKEARLEPILNDPEAEELFFIFADETSGDQTYGAGRYIYTELPAAGKLVIDFNKAYNPPCVFTAYATCPLPPEQNRIPVEVLAGELNYGGH